MSMFNKVSNRERVDFAKNLAVMLKSGITIDEALKSLAEQAKSKVFNKVISNVQREVESCTSLSEAFTKEGKVFDKVFVSLLKAGEVSGTLEENLLFVSDWLERNDDLREEIKAATLYPKIVISATFLLGGLLTMYVLPRLVPLFEQLRVELPPATKILLGFSLFIEKFWFFVLLGVIAIIIAFVLLNKVKSVRRFFHMLYIKVPFLGTLMIAYQLALISQLLSTLFRSGVSINEALDITSEAVTNIRYEESINVMKERVSGGTTFSEAMEDYPDLYPKSLVNIVAVGEKSGTLDNSFMYLSEFYIKEVKNKTKKLPTTIEPILLVVIALLVGFVALAIIMPIYDLTSGLSQ